MIGKIFIAHKVPYITRGLYDWSSRTVIKFSLSESARLVGEDIFVWRLSRPLFHVFQSVKLRLFSSHQQRSIYMYERKVVKCVNERDAYNQLLGVIYSRTKVMNENEQTETIYTECM